MEIILQQDYPALGYVGDTVKVKGGYARNFLIPRGIAMEASSRNEKLLKHKLGGVNAKKIKLRAVAQELAGKLEGVKLEFFLRVGAAGKTFGSITVRDVEQALHKEGYLVDKRQIILTEPLKKAGEHKVTIKLHSEVVASIEVQVNTEVPEQKAKAPEGEKAKGGRRPRARKVKEEQIAVETEEKKTAETPAQ